MKKNLFLFSGRMSTLKKWAICAVLVFVCANVSVHAEGFKKMAKINGVEHVHINKTLLNYIAKNESSINMRHSQILGNDASTFLKKINDMEVYTSDNKEAAEKMDEMMKNITNSSDWKQLVDQKDIDGQKVKIYENKHGKNYTFVVFEGESDEASLTIIKSEQDLSRMLEQYDNLMVKNY